MTGPSPGRVFAAVLPEDLSSFDEEHQLEMKVIKDQMLKTTATTV